MRSKGSRMNITLYGAYKYGPQNICVASARMQGYRVYSAVLGIINSAHFHILYVEVEFKLHSFSTAHYNLVVGGCLLARTMSHTYLGTLAACQKSAIHQITPELTVLVSLRLIRMDIVPHRHRICASLRSDIDTVVVRPMT